MRDRLTRVNDEIQHVLAEALRGEIKDPRVSVMASVLKVETSADLKYCKVYVSVFGDTEEKRAAMTGIRSAGGFLRKAVARRVNLRVTPEFTFVLDESVEQGIRLDGLIRQANAGTKKGEES